MYDAGGKRYLLEGAHVYVHESETSGERILHIDIDHPELNHIILPKESTYAGGREGGIYVGLRPQQTERAQEFVQGRFPD